MNLTPLGAHVAMRGQLQRAPVAANLMALAGNTNITTYVNNGICYDAVAYVRYLLGAVITPAQLVNTTGQTWRPLFNFNAGNLWNGVAAIPAGTAVVFRRPAQPDIFHAALSLGGNIVRGINGNVLGAGWAPAGDCNLNVVMAAIPGGPANVFRYGPAAGDICEVWLSPL